MSPKRRCELSACKVSLILLVCFGACSFGALCAAPQDSNQPHVLSEEVRLVLLPVVVWNHQGHFVTGLTASNFRVYEDGLLQEISKFEDTDVPVTVGIVVDHSGSMAARRYEVIEGALAFVQESNPQDWEFVVNFGNTVSFGLPPGVAFTSNIGELRAALSVPNASGKTALYDAISAALRHFVPDDPNKKVLLLISDGGDNASTHTFRQALRQTQAANVVIYSIGLLDAYSADQNPQVLVKLAKATGGEVYFPNSPEEILSVCKRIAQDIRHQYTLGYEPPANGPEGYRKIRVRVHAPGHGKIFVRTRSGYFYTPNPVSH